MSDGMGRELAYLSSHATNRYFIPIWVLSGTSSLGANLLNIFVPSYFLTVTKRHLVVYIA